MKKIGRNDPCPCGSGKKFKKCCESTMIGGRFKATKMESTGASMAGLFQNRVAPTIQSTSKRFKATTQAPKKEEPPIDSSSGNTGA